MNCRLFRWRGYGRPQPTFWLLRRGGGGVPCPLQGVWTADNGLLPPWKGDYHNDLNLQFTYCHYLTANHLEEGMVLLEHLERLFPQTRKFAQRFYNVPGGCYPGVMALDGTALGGWPMYSLSPTHQIWLCQIAWRHFLYTNDLDFLREIAYPMCQQAAELIWGILCRHGDYLYLPLRPLRKSTKYPGIWHAKFQL
ncbi:MAG: glycosyl hydrolase family 95 catalytic domain-containing protein [Faecalispora jeddahensis]